MAQKPLQLVSGVITQVEASTTSAGAGDAGKLVALNGSGKVDNTMLPTAASFTAVASEAIAAGALVNLYSNAGTINIRNADASGGVAKKADGFAPAAIASGATGEVDFDNSVISGLSSLTVGATYYLSGTTPGAITDTPPSTSAYIVQRIGKAKSATELVFDASSEPVVLA